MPREPLDPLQPIILVHVGAGRQSSHSGSLAKQLMANAMRKGAGVMIGDDVAPDLPDPGLRTSVAALTAVSDVLEASELTNTGYGSCVDCRGEVYCDSSVCVLECQPSGTAYATLHQSAVVSNSSAYPTRDAVRDLVGALARQHDLQQDPAAGTGITPVLMRSGRGPADPGLVSERMARMFEHYSVGQNTEEISDTIGMMVVRPGATVVSATSSGGNLMKPPGRIGCAGVVGAGIYSCAEADTVVSIMCSGNGEDILQLQLARKVCEHMAVGRWEPGTVCTEVARFVRGYSNKGFRLRARDDDNQETLYVGLVGYLECRDFRVVFFFHTTPTMSFAYRQGHRTHSVFSRIRRGRKEKVGEVLLK